MDITLRQLYRSGVSQVGSRHGLCLATAVTAYMFALFGSMYGILLSAYAIISDQPLPEEGLFLFRFVPVVVTVPVFVILAFLLPYVMLVGVRILSVEVDHLGYSQLSKELLTTDILWPSINTVFGVVFFVYGSVLFGMLFLLPGVIFGSVFCLIIYDTTLNNYSITESIRRVWVMTEEKRLDMFAVFTPIFIFAVFLPIITSSLFSFVFPQLLGSVVYLFTLSVVVVFGGFVGSEVYVLMSGYAPTEVDPLLPDWVKLLNPFNWEATRYGDDWSKFR